MAEPSPSHYTIIVAVDPDRFNRYGWRIFENGKYRDKSFNHFATRREAQKDAEAFVDKLTITWQQQN
jgi:hypothetical protein